MKNIIIISIVLSFFSSSWAQSIKGEFKFTKRPPFAGVVYLSEDTSLAGKKDVALDQKDKLFSKKVIVVPRSSVVAFKNSDEIDHNIFSDDKAVDVKFDAGLVAPGSEARQKADWPEGTVARIGCKIHPKMRSYVAVVSSAYFTEIEFNTKEKVKSFEVSAVPENLKKVRVWLPRYEPIEIEISSGETKTVEIKKPGKTTVYGTLTLQR